MNPDGSAGANGPARTANPPPAPPTRAPARLARDVSAGGRAIRQAASSTAAGTAAQNLIATPKPNATPAQASHRGLASRPSRNAAFTASRQARFIHGSSSSVRPESTSAGYTASSPAVTTQASAPRCLTSRPARGTQAG